MAWSKGRWRSPHPSDTPRRPSRRPPPPARRPAPLLPRSTAADADCGAAAGQGGAEWDGSDGDALTAVGGEARLVMQVPDRPAAAGNLTCGQSNCRTPLFEATPGPRRRPDRGLVCACRVRCCGPRRRRWRRRRPRPVEALGGGEQPRERPKERAARGQERLRGEASADGACGRRGCVGASM